MKWYIEVVLQTLLLLVGALLMSYVEPSNITISLYTTMLGLVIYIIGITTVIMMLKDDVVRYNQELEILSMLGYVFVGMMIYLLFQREWYVLVALYPVTMILTRILFVQFEKYIKKKIDKEE